MREYRTKIIKVEETKSPYPLIICENPDPDVFPGTHITFPIEKAYYENLVRFSRGNLVGKYITIQQGRPLIGIGEILYEYIHKEKEND